VWLAAAALVGCLLAPSVAAAAGPGAYVARRFDVNARVLSNGALDVTETITFEFQSGTFQKVWRDLPESRTDGIEIVGARMDDDALTPGEGPGHITVSRRNRIRIEWQFAPVGPSTHTFGLHYIARGVAYRDGASDVVRWRLLPSEHRYKIDTSRTTLAAPVEPRDPALIEKRRAGEVSANQSGNTVTVVASDVGENGWVIAELRYQSGSLVTTLPAWQQRALAAGVLAPWWEMGAAGLFLLLLIILFMMRQGYAAPEFSGAEQTTVTEPPSRLPAALAAVLTAKGRTSGYQQMATLLDLADRGALTVRELPHRFGSRTYEISQVPGKHDLEDHEAEALMIAFKGSGDDVSVSKARGRLARGGRRFAAAVNRDLAARGLIDPARKSVRDRMIVVSVGMLMAGGLGCIGVAPLIGRYEAWPFLLPLAVALSGIAGVIMAASTTPLSDQGLMEAARWRGFKRHLKSLADVRDDRAAAAVPSRWIVYGIAIGLARQWSRYLKKHPGSAPPWFVPSAQGDSGGAFAVFVGSHSAGSGAGGGGGGAAGGGGSGAS
jgi:Predicted membrane protein (DUF2207) C-terminal domain/Predicted membrane protein (DUF2207) N-terminal domain